MKIPFMLKFPNGEETHFIEKLWATSIKYCYSNDIEYMGYYVKYVEIFNKKEITDQCNVPKLHTIRNASDRFKVSQLVQPFVWTYKPYKSNPNPTIPAQFDFMPPLKILSKQRFDIKYGIHKAFVFIDGRSLDEDEISTLAINDGFKDAYHFFQYFNKPVENMEIRHFTNLKY